MTTIPPEMGVTAKSPYLARTVDLLLWRACATGIIDSHTGDFPAEEAKP